MRYSSVEITSQAIAKIDYRPVDELTGRTMNSQDSLRSLRQRIRALFQGKIPIMSKIWRGKRRQDLEESLALGIREQDPLPVEIPNPEWWVYRLRPGTREWDAYVARTGTVDDPGNGPYEAPFWKIRLRELQSERKALSASSVKRLEKKSPPPIMPAQTHDTAPEVPEVPDIPIPDTPVPSIPPIPKTKSDAVTDKTSKPPIMIKPIMPKPPVKEPENWIEEVVISEIPEPAMRPVNGVEEVVISDIQEATTPTASIEQPQASEHWEAGEVGEPEFFDQNIMPAPAPQAHQDHPVAKPRRPRTTKTLPRQAK